MTNGSDDMLEWLPRSEQNVVFDSTVIFSSEYDHFGLRYLSETAYLGDVGFLIWPDRLPNGDNKWSLYSTFEGSTWFHAFESEEAAKSGAEEFASMISTRTTRPAGNKE